jgi:hypothetical protein
MSRWKGKLRAILALCCLAGCDQEGAPSPPLLIVAGSADSLVADVMVDVANEELHQLDQLEIVSVSETASESVTSLRKPAAATNIQVRDYEQLYGLPHSEVRLDLGVCTDVPLAWMEKSCETFCGKMVEHNIGEVFSPGDACLQTCVEVLLEFPSYLPNFLCVAHMQKHHFFSTCWWPKPLPALPECTEFCTILGSCGLHDFMAMPEEQCLCEASCTGFFAMQGSVAAQRLECATGSLAKSCDLDEMYHCWEIPGDCPQRCSELTQMCVSDDALEPLFGSGEGCVEQCKAYTLEQFFALEQCVATTSCGHPEFCSDIGNEPPAPCVESCALLFELCPGIPIEPDECVWACAGIAKAVSDGSVELVPTCLSELDICPTVPLEMMLSCFSDPCEGTCPEIESCPAGSEYGQVFANPEDCQATCQGLTSTQATTFSTCLAWAGCNGASHCLPVAEEVVPGCQEYCIAAMLLCESEVAFPGFKCPAVCSGITQAVAVADPTAGVGCLQSYLKCPAIPEEAVYGCLVPAYPDCIQMCLKESACGLSPEWSCNFSCALEKELSPVLFEIHAECFATAISCPEISACLTEDP